MEMFDSLSLMHTQHTHASMHARTHAPTQTHAHTRTLSVASFVCLCVVHLAVHLLVSGGGEAVRTPGEDSAEEKEENTKRGVCSQYNLLPV